MIKFLAKGLLRDRSRSLFPIITVIAGTLLTVVMYSWVQGAVSQMFDLSARFATGHVKVMTRAYNEISDQIPNDLAILGLKEQLATLRAEYPHMIWFPRIQFGGLLDVPGAHGETMSQGPVMGLGLEFGGSDSGAGILNINKAIVRGRVPQGPDEILISEELAKKLGVKPGQQVTLLGSTMSGSMSIYNFLVSGTMRFGISALDRSMIIADIRGVQNALDMPDGAGEILGLDRTMIFDEEKTAKIISGFNQKYSHKDDEFSPQMISLRDQMGMGALMDMMNVAVSIMVSIFIFVMSLVLWNAGLIGGLRRFGEIGLRLAIGESKPALYKSMIAEAVLIGIAGSIGGTLLGLMFAFYLQEVGFDLSGMLQGSEVILFPDIIRARVTPGTYYIAFIPGVFASVLGTMFAGIGVFKRQTAQLFKELEV
ncbi:ABC transporter permease [Candidatus Margulisiibacteriota bacterium]